MILIADSGSTKTDWRLIAPDGSIAQYQCEGLNPWFHTEASVSKILHQTFEADLRTQITAIHFYGAGVTPGEQTAHMLAYLHAAFPNAELEVADDMLGAARALCDHGKGMVAILGTGANTCLSDGHQILEKQPSLGYVLGDEGSGAHLGKLLLKRYLQGELSDTLSVNLEKRFEVDRLTVIRHLYKEPHPNRYLAQFARFLHQNKNDESAVQVIADGFAAFFEHQITKYPEHPSLPLHITGSVGYYFGDFLRKMAMRYDVHIGRVVEKPIAALALYHQPA